MPLKNYLLKNRVEAGCDEAGRGCLAGPVVAACVILPKGFRHPLLNDSKAMTENQRKTLAPIIMAKALAYGIGLVDNNEIDQINILNASFLAMHRAIDKLQIKPEHLIVDGNRFNKYPTINHTCIIKGDSKFNSIAAASVLAKVYRDHLMDEFDAAYPMYNWSQNKGYPTKAHRKAIKEFGACPLHRSSFKLLADEQFTLDL